MKIAFRADASVQIGTGHVMRCLTLANELRGRGHTCRFVCRDLLGHLSQTIGDAGFDLTLLPAPAADFKVGDNDPDHAAWAGVPWKLDAEQTLAAAHDVDWLVVDHYAFDARWQDAALGPKAKFFVIDDLADRPHNADLLLDQNLGRSVSDYDGLVPLTCTRLIGPAYVLMRPEFAELREESLARRKSAQLAHILVTMGGMDNDDVTSKVLTVIAKSDLPEACEITVVMGRNAPWLSKVRGAAARMPRPTHVVVDVTQMASLMLQSDLAIGAAGGTSWERCSLGLPSLHLVLADNQASAAQAIDDAQISVLLGDVRRDDWQIRLHDTLERIVDQKSLECLGTGTFDLLDGLGCTRTAIELERDFMT